MTERPGDVEDKKKPLPVPDGGPAPEETDAVGRMLDELQRDAHTYFLAYADPSTGLISDSSERDSPASIAATGMGLSCYPVAVERGYLSRTNAAERVRVTLRFLMEAEQSESETAAGYRGFFYHFLEPSSGRRAWECELSSIDTAILLAGVLTCGQYFDEDDAVEAAIRSLSDQFEARIDWKWMCAGHKTVSHGWKPESGFLAAHWMGYSEGLLLYLLALGSSESALPVGSYETCCSAYEWKESYGHRYLYAGPLFIHQFPQLWVDLKGLRDEAMREHDSDYFQNSRLATQVHWEYAKENPKDFEGYGAHCWGLTACNGPGPARCTVEGKKREFYSYLARGAPEGPDDGTVAPWAAVASLPFAPEIVLPTIRYFQKVELGSKPGYGFEATFNPTFPHAKGNKYGWVSPTHLAINQGPVVLMIENYRTGLIWDLMRDCPVIQRGLRRAGFKSFRE